MKENLIQLLGLKPAKGQEITDQEIIAAVQSLQNKVVNIADENTELKEALHSARPTTTNAREQAINRKIEQSHGALNREQAALSVDAQAAEDAARKK